MYVNVKKDFMEMGYLVLVCMISYKLQAITAKKNLVRGEIISTYQPYRADEQWESTFSCQSNQFVELKFDTMDFSQTALDIIKIQLLTEELSKFMPSHISYISSFNDKLRAA